MCSITLSNLNVYACLVCGRYFQGRGKKTQAHLHALESLHYMFINLHDERVYCLPDNYEVVDASLNDIKVSQTNRSSISDPGIRWSKSLVSIERSIDLEAWMGVSS